MMVGIGETYLPAFALAAGIGEIAAGLVSTVPLVMGATLQLLAPAGLRRCGSYRRWITLSAFCQATSFLPLVIGSLVGWLPAGLVFLSAALYWGTGLATGAAWNTWIGTLVPSRVRAPYFAWRTRVTQAGIVLGFVVGGVALQLGHSWGRTLDAFALLFLVASVCRFVSVGFLAAQSEPVRPPSGQCFVTLNEFVRRIRTTTEGGLLLYFLAVAFAVQISGPYFNPYMLQQLRFSYAEYVVLVASAYVSRVVTLPALGKFASRFGARKLLWLGGVGIAPLSGAWLFCDSFAGLIVLQLIVGVFWAAYELSVFLLFLEAIPSDERTGVLTAFNFANAVCTAAGSLLGGAVLAWLGQRPEIYLTLFVGSSFARVAALVLLWRVPNAETATEVETSPILSILPRSAEPITVETGYDRGVAA
jgi:MFS family permease